MKQLYLILVFLGCVANLFGGDSTDITLMVVYGDRPEGIAFVETASTFSNQTDLEGYLSGSVRQLQSEGYFETSVDSLVCGADVCSAYVHIGNRWEDLRIEYPDSLRTLDWNFLNIVDDQEKIRPEQLTLLLDEKAERLARNGYPFATVCIGNIAIDSNSISASLTIEPGRKIYFDEIRIQGDQALTPGFLAQYLQWHEGEVYDHETFLKLEDRLKELPYVKLLRTPVVQFYYDRARLVLTLEKKRSNKFDFLLGVLPANDAQERGLLLSVFLNTELQNVLGLGERILFDFRNTKPRTQELELAFNYPYVLDMPFGIETSLELFRNQETNLDLRYLIGLSYLPSRNLTVTAFWDRFSSTILNPDTTFLKINRKLPSNLDHVNNKVGVSARFLTLNNIISPKKGWDVRLKATAGFKNIERNNDLLEFESTSIPVAALYDTLGSNQDQFEIDVSVTKYWPFWKRFTFKTQVRARSILGSNSLLFNELYRTGGSTEIRGFDEEFFRASSYAMGIGEIRFFLTENSFLSAFVDYAILETKTLNQNQEFDALGFGLGINFETRVGIFGLSYALGQTRDIPLDFNSGKVHFGYVSLF